MSGEMIRQRQERRALNILQAFTGGILQTSDGSKALTERGKKKLTDSGVRSYYNLPLIKKAHWSWNIIIYFFLGGMAGGSYLAATLADLLGSARDVTLIRAGRYLSFVCIVISPILLIIDLGRPERFLHMMRVLKLRSPMSLGTWALTFFGLFCGLTTAYQAAQDGLLTWLPFFPRLLKALPIKLIESIGTFFGLFVASYTGVLLSSTAVPVWARARHILGPLFLTSGISSGLSALSFILSLGRNSEDTLDRVEQAELITLTTELGLISALPPTLGPLSKPVFKGRLGLLFNAGTIGGGVVLPLLIRLPWRLVRKPTPRAANIGASLLVLVGGLIIRYVWIVAGRLSADDPWATHYYNSYEWDKSTNK
jgi:formate-dependent nitrite reductase membrane component NrfD